MDSFTATMVVEQDWDMAGVEPSEEVFIEAAQQLINDGTAWTLQGSFGRTCAALIAAGDCHQPNQGEI